MTDDPFRWAIASGVRPPSFLLGNRAVLALIPPSRPVAAHSRGSALSAGHILLRQPAVQTDES